MAGREDSVSESQIMREGWAEMVKAGGKLWRNNVGQGIVGKSRWVGRTAMVENASRVQYGLCVGSPDLVGHLSTVITQDMVGKRIAIAVYAEAKKQPMKTHLAIRMGTLKISEVALSG